MRGFETREGLKVDGLLDPRVWLALGGNDAVEVLKSYMGTQTECYAKDLMEQALAHEKDSLVAAYFREDLLEQRRQMMQDWADYVTGGQDMPTLKIGRAPRS